ncbi:SRPBCC domain-containing protein [Phenylobacterium sp.]|uniref:SRPBCC domain-containing protein n=1 Tax=Phenylobacterium sp. TaxID=1871053 RepID=UPI0030F3F8CB
MATSTRTSRIIRAAPEALYDAWMDPDILVQWLPPAEMTGQLHAFEGRVGGGYDMSLFYPETEQAHPGKTSDKEDRVHVRFLELTPPRRILQAVTFDTQDPSLKGEMTMEISFEPTSGGTDVTILAANIPPGIRPADNDEGSRLSLEQLAQRFE